MPRKYLKKLSFIIVTFHLIFTIFTQILFAQIGGFDEICLELAIQIDAQQLGTILNFDTSPERVETIHFVLKLYGSYAIPISLSFITEVREFLAIVLAKFDRI